MDRFFKSIAYIEANLEEPLCLADIASAAHYSSFHYARTFRALTGYSVMGYLAARRLSEAAIRLSKGDSVRLIDLAITSGYSSQAAFARAFKAHFGITPGAFRRSNTVVSQYFCLPLKHWEVEQMKDMEPRIVNMPAIHVIGLRERFSDSSKDGIPALWERFGKHYAEIPGKTEAAGYGVCIANGEGEGEFDYLAGAEVVAGTEAPDGFDHIDIMPQTYAVFTHQVRSDVSLHEGVQTAVRYIWGVWLPASEYEQVESPDFERYDDRFDPESLTGEFDICVPVRRKS